MTDRIPGILQYMSEKKLTMIRMPSTIRILSGCGCQQTISKVGEVFFSSFQTTIDQKVEDCTNSFKILFYIPETPMHIYFLHKMKHIYDESTLRCILSWSSFTVKVLTTVQRFNCTWKKVCMDLRRVPFYLVDLCSFRRLTWILRPRSLREKSTDSTRGVYKW